MVTRGIPILAPAPPAQGCGLSSPRLAAYHRSSGGMRLIWDLSSSAASMESSVGGGGGPDPICLDLNSWDLFRLDARAGH